MKDTIYYWLRWIVVLPGALIAGILATFPLHMVLSATLSGWVEPYPELPERILTPFVISGIFIWVGSRIAPEHKIEAAVVLFGVWLFVMGGFVFLALSGADWMGNKLNLQYGGVAAVMAIVGALTALYYVRKEGQKEKSKQGDSLADSGTPGNVPALKPQSAIHKLREYGEARAKHRH